MQVFYVNIGGGEPTVRPDFWELVDYATAHHVGREVLHQRRQDHPGDRRAGWPPATTSTCRSRWTARPPRSTTPSAAAGSYATALRAMGNLADAGLRGLQDLGGRHPAERGQLDDVPGAGRPLRRAAAADPAAAVGPRRGRLGRAAPHRRPAARALRLAARPRRAGADRRLVLPPGRLRPGAAGAEPVRRGPGGVPDRPGRRRVRLPVRHPRQLPRRQRPRPAAGSPRCGASPSCSPTCASPQTGGACQSCSAYDSCRGGCMAAKFFTGLPLDGPDPECVNGHGDQALAAVDQTAKPRPSLDHSHRAQAGRHRHARRPGARLRRQPAGSDSRSPHRADMTRLVDLTWPTWPSCGPPPWLARAGRARPAARPAPAAVHRHRAWRSPCASGWRRGAATSSSRPPSATARAASTRASPARCRSARPPLSWCSSNWAGRPASPSPTCCPSSGHRQAAARCPRRGAAARVSRRDARRLSAALGRLRRCTRGRARPALMLALRPESVRVDLAVARPHRDAGRTHAPAAGGRRARGERHRRARRPRRSRRRRGRRPAARTHHGAGAAR